MKRPVNERAVIRHGPSLNMGHDRPDAQRGAGGQGANLVPYVKDTNAVHKKHIRTARSIPQPRQKLRLSEHADVGLKFELRDRTADIAHPEIRMRIPLPETSDRWQRHQLVSQAAVQDAIDPLHRRTRPCRKQLRDGARSESHPPFKKRPEPAERNSLIAPGGAGPDTQSGSGAFHARRLAKRDRQASANSSDNFLKTRVSLSPSVVPIPVSGELIRAGLLEQWKHLRGKSFAAGAEPGTMESMVGQFFTPETVSECMYRLVGVHPGQRVIDPSCGDGAFLRAAPRGLELYACEIDPQHAAVARRLVAAKHFAEGDALTSLVDAWGTYDLAIGNPPFSAQASLEKRANILCGFDLGTGRKSQCLEVLFLELFWKLAKPNGKIAIILPDGPLSNRPFKYVRNWLLCRAHVQAIISLPRGIFNRTSAKTSILIAQRLPVSPQPYREPTCLLECKDLSELRLLRLSDRREAEPRWKQAVLADEADWRPEAQKRAVGEKASDSVRLGDIFSLRTGFARYGEKREFFDVPSDHRVALIRAKNIAPDGGLRLDRNCAYISRDGEMFRHKSVVHPGEILFVRVGAGCYGRAAVVPQDLTAQADDWIHVLTPLFDVDCQGVVEWFNSESGREAVRRLAKGVGTLSVSKSSLAELKLPAHLKKSNDLVLTPDSKPKRASRRKLTGVS